MLPIEIFEAIIDQANDDAPCLRHLSLACHVFLPRARYHLFRSIVLQNAQHVESYSQFLDSNVWVRPLVRKLVHSSFTPISESHPTAPMLDVVPLHLLSRLPNLRTWEMGMAGIGYRTEAGAWLSCRRTALSSYQNYSSNIVNLELAYVPFEDICDFIVLVSAFTSIRNLTCSHIWIKTSIETAPHSSETNTPTQVKSLQVSTPGDLLVYLELAVEISYSKVTTTVDIAAIEYLLDSSQTTLNTLAVTFQSRQSDHYFGEIFECPLSSQRPDDFDRTVGTIGQFAIPAVLFGFCNPVYGDLLGR